MGPLILGGALLAGGLHAEAARLFARAAQSRADAPAAALACEALADACPDTPADALRRALAWRYAGDSPRAVAALREGLALDPFQPELRRVLTAELRSIGLPTELPPPAWPGPLGWALALAGCGMLAAWRAGRASPWAGVAFLALGLSLGVWDGLSYAREAERCRRPLAVALERATLREGNAVAFAPVGELPAGASIEVLATRGGWLRTPGGWVPATAVRLCRRHP